jgi:hypothetical protein
MSAILLYFTVTARKFARGEARQEAAAMRERKAA